MNFLSLALGLLFFFIGYIILPNKNGIVKYLALIYFIIYFLNLAGPTLFSYDIEVFAIAPIYFSIVTLIILGILSRFGEINFQVNWNIPLIILFLIVLVSMIVTSFSRIIDAYSILIDGNFRQIRNLVYSGEVSVVANSRIESYMALISGYFRIPFLLLCLSLHSTRFSKYIIYLVLLSFLPIVFSAILTASRGMIMIPIFDLLILYFFAKRNNIKLLKSKLSYFTGIVFLLVFIISNLIYVSNVTQSRFEDIGVNESILGYLSHSIYFYSSSIQNFDEYLMGAYTLYNIPFFKGQWDINQLTSALETDTGFFTYLGGFHLDFGFLGGILLVMAILIFVYPFSSSKKNNVSNQMLYFFICEQMFLGVFVWGAGIGVTFIVIFIVSRILYIINN